MRALIVDLNNFSMYPTIAVGYLAAILRQNETDVRVFSPLAHGVAGVAREPTISLVGQHVRYRTAVSKSRLVRSVRNRIAAYRRSQLLRETRRIAKRIAHQIEEHQPSIVLVSTYLMYFELCRLIGRVCKTRGIPVLLGGPYFAEPDVAHEWSGIDGVSGLVRGEVEPDLAEIVNAATHTRDALSEFPSVCTNATSNGFTPPPLRDLDALPFPDFSDFPWDRYPSRMIPISTGRGCGWGVCTFCSDITSTAHRTYRSRGVGSVLRELEYQSRRHRSAQVVFSDLMLNSNLDVWRAIHANMQALVPGAEWIASVHVTDRDDNGLSRDELRAARKSGLVRVTTGFESGSQRVLDSMRKGTNVERSGQFAVDASEAGISVRMTMILGYPGEKAEDVEATAKFIETHGSYIERVQLNRFQIMIGSAFEKQLTRRPDNFPGVTSLTINRRHAVTDHRYREVDDPSYRHAVRRLFRAVHEVNRRPLRPSARAFEGVM